MDDTRAEVKKWLPKEVENVTGVPEDKMGGKVDAARVKQHRDLWCEAKMLEKAGG